MVRTSSVLSCGLLQRAAAVSTAKDGQNQFCPFMRLASKGSSCLYGKGWTEPVLYFQAACFKGQQLSLRQRMVRTSSVLSCGLLQRAAAVSTAKDGQNQFCTFRRLASKGSSCLYGKGWSEPVLSFHAACFKGPAACLYGKGWSEPVLSFQAACFKGQQLSLRQRMVRTSSVLSGGLLQRAAAVSTAKDEQNQFCTFRRLASKGSSCLWQRMDRTSPVPSGGLLQRAAAAAICNFRRFASK